MTLVSNMESVELDKLISGQQDIECSVCSTVAELSRERL